jgi:hypothetical protein
MAAYKIGLSQPQAKYLGKFEANDTIENLFDKPIVVCPVDATTLKLDRTKDVTIPKGETGTLTEAGTYFIVEGHNTFSTVPQPFLVG